YLIHLGIDQLKIDGSLVRDLDKNKGSYIIVKTIINFAKDMNIETIAEQVETQAELDVLCELGVDMIQGYLLAKPKAELF
ncbi:MAG: EAL domain-containing protein, partial [Campylobacterota bacterium]|nr:EAL domain-containing protein [Campylobacterota bacterium]